MTTDDRNAAGCLLVIGLTMLILALSVGIGCLFGQAAGIVCALVATGALFVALALVLTTAKGDE